MGGRSARSASASAARALTAPKALTATRTLRGTREAAASNKRETVARVPPLPPSHVPLPLPPLCAALRRAEDALEEAMRAAADVETPDVRATRSAVVAAAAAAAKLSIETARVARTCERVNAHKNLVAQLVEEGAVEPGSDYFRRQAASIARARADAWAAIAASRRAAPHEW